VLPIVSDRIKGRFSRWPLYVVPTYFPYNICTNIAVPFQFTLLFGISVILVINFIQLYQHHIYATYCWLTTDTNIQNCESWCDLPVTLHLLNDLRVTDSLMSRTQWKCSPSAVWWFVSWMLHLHLQFKSCSLACIFFIIAFFLLFSSINVYSWYCSLLMRSMILCVWYLLSLS